MAAVITNFCINRNNMVAEIAYSYPFIEQLFGGGVLAFVVFYRFYR